MKSNIMAALFITGLLLGAGLILVSAADDSGRIAYGQQYNVNGYHDEYINVCVLTDSSGEYILAETLDRSPYHWTLYEFDGMNFIFKETRNSNSFDIELTGGGETYILLFYTGHGGTINYVINTATMKISIEKSISLA